jgi:hypothetical protein
MRKDPTVFKKSTGRVFHEQTHKGKPSQWAVSGKGFRISATGSGNPYLSAGSVDVLWSRDANVFSSDLAKAAAFVKKHKRSCSFLTIRL